jgi:ADP-ribose pyrophosphatase YjhB (NUDIX family)
MQKNFLPTRFRPGAKAFIVHEGKILIVRENILENGESKVWHDVPGGGLEPGETLAEGLQREVMEEVGLRVQVERPVGCWEFMREEATECVHIICTGFQCSLVGAATIDVHNNPADEDIFETVWMTKEEILAVPELFDSADFMKTVENVQI